MIRSVLHSLAQKTAVVAIGGTVVVFSATFALAAANDDPPADETPACEVHDETVADETAADEGVADETDTTDESVDTVGDDEVADDEGTELEGSDDGATDDECATEGDETEGDDSDDATPELVPTDDPAPLFDEVADDEITDDEGGADDGDATYRNHGEAVSEAAKTCPPGPGHGACVSAVAKSDLGKKAKHHDEVEGDETEIEDDEAEHDDEIDEIDVHDDDDAQRDAGTHPGRGHGKDKAAKAKGHGGD